MIFNIYQKLIGPIGAQENTMRNNTSDALDYGLTDQLRDRQALPMILLYLFIKFSKAKQSKAKQNISFS
jgi:hypothetical protein